MGLSTHVLDTMHGCPAAGMGVALYATDGERATLLHGLNTPECGLLSMMRCYDPNDRAHILELFEQAATSSSHFCYSTTIGLANGHRQPVFCVGESDGLEHSSTGSMACRLESFFSCRRMYGFSSSVVIFSALVMKYGDR